MPRLTAGGPSDQPIDDSVITRVDISPEDIRKMSDEDLHSLLASIRNKRETVPPRTSRAKGNPKALRELGSPDDLEEMD